VSTALQRWRRTARLLAAVALSQCISLLLVLQGGGYALREPRYLDAERCLAIDCNVKRFDSVE
jgi:hypothetical protein